MVVLVAVVLGLFLVAEEVLIEVEVGGRDFEYRDDGLVVSSKTSVIKTGPDVADGIYISAVLNFEFLGCSTAAWGDAGT